MIMKHVVGVIAASAAAVAVAAPPADVAAFMAIRRSTPDAEVRYGSAPAQAIDVFLPEGAGPHPVVVLIHGGCWNVRTAGREQLRHLGTELSGLGFAVWSIGYRRANEAGGGYPGTYEDVGAALDLLRSQGPLHRMDPSRAVLVGHSAGGHLALWAAVRSQLPAGSVLRTPEPFVPAQVISLAGIGDLEASAETICGPDISQRLGGAAASSSSGGEFSDVSPAALPPPKGRIVMISGLNDRVVPPGLASDHVQVMVAKGMPTALISLVPIADAGHFDLVTPGTPAWQEVLRQITAALAQP